ncbi:hypothetical protein NMG60_11022338 [Bertholletia excelsa]
MAMATHHHPAELESSTANSMESMPPSDYIADHPPQLVRFMCSFGGKILPRPHDNQLRYVGGDTRIVAVHRHATTFSSLLAKLSKLAGTPSISVKYQLPNEDLDALITVTGDEDLENMMEEYDRFSGAGDKASRLRLFLFSNDTVSRTSSISSLLDGSAKRENWFIDALNSGSGLERGRSEVSSIVSEVPDYLFGLETSDDPPRDPKLKSRLNMAETVSNSDPGSPAPVVSSPFCSTSSSLAPPIPNLPPVKTKLENPVPVLDRKESHEFESQGRKEAEVESFSESQQSRNAGNINPQWQYVPDVHYRGGPTVQPVSVYYMPGSVPPGNIPFQPVLVRNPYVQPFPAAPGQVPAGFPQPVPGMGHVSQVYVGGGRPVAVDGYDTSGRVAPDGLNPHMYYGIRGGHPGMMVPGGEEPAVSETEMGRASQS